MHERRYFRQEKQLTYEHNGKRRRLVPDAGFLLRVSPQASENLDTEPTLQLNFVEFDNGSLSTARLAAKYDAYNQWSTSAAGRQYLQDLNDRHKGAMKFLNFRLLIIARSKLCGRDEQRLFELVTVALDLPRRLRERIWLTTVASLNAHQRDSPPLNAPIWMRLRDARDWVHTLRHLPRKNGINRAGKGLFVEQQLARLLGHSLLPNSRYS